MPKAVKLSDSDMKRQTGWNFQGVGYLSSGIYQDYWIIMKKLEGKCWAG